MKNHTNYQRPRIRLGRHRHESSPDSRATHEALCRWLDATMPNEPHARQRLLTPSACCHLTALGYIAPDWPVQDGWRYGGFTEEPCDIVSDFVTFYDDKPTYRTGALRFHFHATDSDESFDVLHIAAWVSDDEVNNTMLAFASVPTIYIDVWLAFQAECSRIAHSAIPFRGKVMMIGGTDATFEANVTWDDIYLPNELKEEIRKDVAAFFARGVEIYRRLNIKPFRKLLLAGVPGTGKTMLCSAVARWAQSQGYFVIYVSGSNQFGAKFWKIHDALDRAASSDAPSIIIVEELDAYLDDESRAELLNVLDGNETPENPHGTLMIATTNHPEEIDQRVMKRPGRLDRIFIIPELHDEADAEKMLRIYMGEAWDEEHRTIVPRLLGRPGAFIREVALHALTMAAYHGHETVPLTVLTHSLDTLIEQIEAKDDFLTANRNRRMGLAPERRRSGFLRIDSLD